MALWLYIPFDLCYQYIISLRRDIERVFNMFVGNLQMVSKQSVVSLNLQILRKLVF